MKYRIVITGGSGLLALNWALAIRDQYKVLLGMHNRFVELCGVESMFFPLDSVEKIVKTLKKYNPDLVINTVGLTNVEQCELYPEVAKHINVEIASNISRACSILGIFLVHVSTDHLFTGDKKMVDEKQSLGPLNVYSRTKAEAEKRVLEENKHTLVVRTNFFGWGPSYRRSFSDTIIDSFLNSRPMTLFQDVFFTPILAENLVLTTHELVRQGVSGIINIVGDERLSKFDFGIKLAKIARFNPKLIRPGLISEHTELVQGPFDISLSNKKVCSILKRNIGGADKHIERLIEQDKIGFAKNVKDL